MCVWITFQKLMSNQFYVIKFVVSLSSITLKRMGKIEGILVMYNFDSTWETFMHIEAT